MTGDAIVYRAHSCLHYLEQRGHIKYEFALITQKVFIFVQLNRNEINKPYLFNGIELFERVICETCEHD